MQVVVLCPVFRVTVCVTCAGADGRTPSDEKKAEAWKMPENAAESPASGAREVSPLPTLEQIYSKRSERTNKIAARQPVNLL
jgi:hypothetical protein